MRILVSDLGYQDKVYARALIHNQLKIKVIRRPPTLELARPYRFLPTGKRNVPLD